MRQGIKTFKILIFTLFGIIIIGSFLSKTVQAIEVDPYSYNTIGLRLDLTYTDERSYNSLYDKTETSRGFEQRYSIDAKGLVVNPNLMTYKAGIEFVDEEVGGSLGDRSSTMSKYEFGSTFLRRSRIPLTVSASRTRSDTSYEEEKVTDKYGIDWYLKFKTLPWTRLTHDKTLTQASGTNEDKGVSTLSLLKVYGSTKNSLKYSITDISDNLRNYSSLNNELSLRNDTALPLKTSFYAAMETDDLSVKQIGDEQNTTAMTGAVGLASDPIDGLKHRMSYTLTEMSSDGNGTGSDSINEVFSGSIVYSNKSDFTGQTNVQKTINEISGSYSDGTGYTSGSSYDHLNGSMSYTPTKNLKMYTLGSLSNKESYAATTETVLRTEAYSAGASHAHSITKNLSASESVTYSNERSNAGDQYTGRVGREIGEASAELNYKKYLRWADLTAGSLLGLRQEKIEPDEGGDGISYGYNAGLTGIKSRHFSYSTNYNYYSVYSNVGDIGQNDQTFKTEATGLHGENLPMKISYTYHNLESYLEGEGIEENTVEANLGINYVKKLPVTWSYNYYTAARPDSIPPELQYLYIKEKRDDKIDGTAQILHVKWLPMSVTYKNYLLFQPYEVPSAPLSDDQQYYHIKEQKEEGVGFGANLTYFRNVSASASFGYSRVTESRYNTSTGVTEETGYKKKNMVLSGSHNRPFLRGRLGLSTGYDVTITDNITQDIREYYSTLKFDGTFDKKMSRSVMLKLNAGQSFTDTNGDLDSQLTGKANIYYKLRAWYFSAEYEHSLKTQETLGNSTVIEDRIMLKASRSFVRIF